MVRNVSQIYAVIVASLALFGLLSTGHLLELMNVDIAIDLIRVVLAAALIYAGFFSEDEKTAKNALFSVGILYVIMGLFGLVNPTLGGLLPSGLTGFDIGFHLLSGSVAVIIATTKHSEVMSTRGS